MKKNILGQTGLEVTELCFGALPMGPLQKDMPVEESARVVEAALKGGINFIDTAQGYKTYEPIRRALKKVDERPIIATKSPVKTYEEMQKAVDEALQALELDCIDIFHLHGARAGANVFSEREGALRCLVDNKKKGKIKAVGISTHSVSVVNIAAGVEEIDVVFPIINMQGIGILDGTKEEMEKAIAACRKSGKGIYLMKVLGGGRLVNDYGAAMKYARSLEGYDSIALGMVSTQEVDFNLQYFNAEDVDKLTLPSFKGYSKKFFVFKLNCKKCGICIETCPNNAITLMDGIPFIEDENCLQCGYCAGACPDFNIRTV